VSRELTGSLAEGVRRREVVAWAFYDFANSGYTTVVITAVFNAYFVAEVAGNAPWATLAWTSALAVSYALIVLTGPIVGAYADARAAKKRLLVVTTIGCVTFTAALALVGRGDVMLACLLIALSNYFFGTGENLIAAFLPEIARGDAVGRISGWGWSLGYLGGLASLAACLAYVLSAQAAGASAAEYVPVTMLITAGIFAIASLPTFVFLRERVAPALPNAGGFVRGAVQRVLHTLRQARLFADLERFLLCIVFYQAGIQTVIALAAIYAQQVMGFAPREILVLVLVVNVTAALGAFVFGQMQDRFGHINTLVATLIGWLLAIALSWAAREPMLFWAAANVVGLCLGASQSAGRALVAYLSPPARAGEFFGLWGLGVKLSSILGPMTYGLVTWVSGGDHRTAILVTGTFFLAGILIVKTIDVERGRRAALQS
jgi:UMF1 family MFS transporter